ncbi:MAG: sensor histidine kinase [Candidatus Limnocylindrales bacterium]|nr:sensor histidine kinase [Candidatus Limnocylindrales bacterium]
MHRFRHLGLQKRIMLYVVVGLAVMFGVVAVLGLDAIDEATRLVYRERLSTAHTTAGILERDFARVAAAIETAHAELFPGSGTRVPAGAATRLLARFQRTPDEYPYFAIGGVWILDASGRVLDGAGTPDFQTAAGQVVSARIAETPAGRLAVLEAAGSASGAQPFAALALRIASSPPNLGPIVVVHTVSLSRGDPFVPADHGEPRAPGEPGPSTGITDEYHLEVVGPDGITLLGIGADEHPGHPSPHFAAIRDLVATGSSATLLHDPGGDGDGAPHVMAAVPLGSSPFYVVLEQPVDVALALPNQLRDRLFLSIGFGLILILAVAWITTRRVVKPTDLLMRAAERMAGGDLASPIEVRAQDEVGQLAESLEAMRQRLNAAQGTIERANRELESRVADRTARLGQVLRKTISAQEEERLRLARELHDETAQALAALTIALDRTRDDLEAGSPDARGRILEARGIAAGLLEEIRRLILGLRPSVLDDLGLVPAIRWLCEASLADRGIEVLIEAEQAGPRLPAHVEVTLFRIIQEAVSNIARHAGATHVRVGFGATDGAARVTIVDDGGGFDVAQTIGPTGSDRSVGLVGMQERVGLLGGTIEIRSAAGFGTEIVVNVPLVPEAA